MRSSLSGICRSFHIPLSYDRTLTTTHSVALLLQPRAHLGASSLQGFYPLFVDLMHCDSKLVRQTLRDIFSNRISTVLQQQQQV